MHNINKATSIGLCLLWSSSVWAQTPEPPQKLNYSLKDIKYVDGSKSGKKGQNAIMKQPTAPVALVGASKTLFIHAPMPASKNIDLNDAASVRSAAFDLLNSIHDQLGIGDANQSFSPVFQQQDAIGMSHVKMQQLYQGVPVFGAETFVHLKAGQDGTVNGKCIPETQLSNINTNPSFDAINAQAVAISFLKKETTWTDLSADAQKILHYTAPEKELIIFQDFHDQNKISLAWHFTIRPNALERWEYFVDAHTGRVLYHYDNTCTDGPVTGQATDVLNLTRGLNLYQVGSTYYMIDASKSMFKLSSSSFPDNPAGAIRTVDARNTDIAAIYDISSTTNTFWPDASSVSAHYQAGECYDYYEKTFGRHGLDGNGGTMLSVVNVTSGGANMDNAYWNGQLMAYGNGNVLFTKPLAAALDVTGHEMTHGVIQSTANLTYQDVSGAINESFADIFGCMIDRANWTIGEKVVNYAYFPSGALRNMADPHNGGTGPSSNGWQPAKVSEYVTTTADHGGVHTNSGITNFAYYKIATATSKDTAEQVFYRTLTLYLTRSSQFIDLRLAVIQAATDLYGANSHFVKVAKSSFDAVQIFDGTGNDFQEDLKPVFGTDYVMVHTAPYNDSSIYIVKPKNPTSHDFHAISLNQARNRPSITDDGQRGYFIDYSNNINKIAIDTLKYKNFIVGFTGYSWNNVAISKDSTKLALTREPNDTSIYVVDIHDPSHLTATRYHLFNPTYATGIQTGGPVYANTLEWDPTGEFVMYDSYNQIGSGGTQINYWDVGFLTGWDNTKKTYGDGSITKLFASLPKGVDLTNPAYSKNSPYIITYDYFDENTKTYSIYTSNIEHGFDSSIYTNNTLGYPTFSKNDDILAFTSIASNKDTIIAQIPLHANKMSPSGSVSTMLKGYKWSVWYTRGLRSGVKAQFNTIDNKICELNNNVFYSSSLGNVKTYSWNFGTNATPQTSTSAGPIPVVFNKTGTQVISLIVKDSLGKADTFKTTILVYAASSLTITEGANHVLTLNKTLNVSNIQWYLNGKAIPGANAYFYTASSSGMYTASGTATSGCVSTAPAYHFVNAGIDAAHPLIQASVYPNPSHGQFTLEFEMGRNENVTLNVTNLLGQELYHEQLGNMNGLNSKTLDLQNLPSGVYLLKMEAGSSVFTQRIVIEK